MGLVAHTSIVKKTADTWGPFGEAHKRHSQKLGIYPNAAHEGTYTCEAFIDHISQQTEYIPKFALTENYFLKNIKFGPIIWEKCNPSYSWDLHKKSKAENTNWEFDGVCVVVGLIVGFWVILIVILNFD